jgi:tetratricopeptide (TPR) repeat protein
MSSESVDESAANERRLESLLSDIDPTLLASLKRDERRRRRKLFLFTITGGLIMGSAIAILLMTVLHAGEVSPQDADRALGLANEGWQLWQTQKFKEARDKFKEAVKLDPKLANAWNGLGWAQLNNGDADDAEKSFAKCVELEKSNGAALNGLGVIAYSRRDYENAEKRWLAADAPAAWVGLTRLYLLQGKYEDAEKWGQKVLEQEPDNQMIAGLIGAAKAKMVTPELRAQLEPAAAVQTGEAARGWALFNRGQMNQAKQAFEAALKKNPKDGAARNGLAFCLLNLGKAKEAQPMFEALLKDEPDAPGPMNGLARCLSAQGKRDEAIALWEKMQAKYPGPNAATAGLAWAYLEKKEYAKAIPLFEELLKATPDDANLKQGLAKAKSGLNQ